MCGDLLLHLKSINANLHLLKGSPFSNNLRKLSAGSTVPISVTVLWTKLAIESAKFSDFTSKMSTGSSLAESL